MRRYRNINTGAMIETHNQIHGKDWQEVFPSADLPVKETEKRRAKAETVKK